MATIPRPSHFSVWRRVSLSLSLSPLARFVELYRGVGSALLKSTLQLGGMLPKREREVEGCPDSFSPIPYVPLQGPTVYGRPFVSKVGPGVGATRIQSIPSEEVRLEPSGRAENVQTDRKLGLPIAV